MGLTHTHTLTITVLLTVGPISNITLTQTVSRTLNITLTCYRTGGGGFANGLCY